MTNPQSAPDTRRQAVCDIVYVSFAVWATLKLLVASMENADFLLSWTSVLPGIVGPALAMALSVMFSLLVMLLPAFWAILWPHRFMPSSEAIFAAFMIFNCYAYLSILR